MTADSDFTISFDLPDGWTPVPPESCGAEGAAFVAVRTENAHDPVATNLIAGYTILAEQPDFAAIAGAYVADLRSRFPVTVLKSDSFNDGKESEFNQLLEFDFPTGESTVRLRQIRILMTVPSVNENEPTGVMQLQMTCPAEIFPVAGREFQRFVKTIAPNR